jgi:hypothetical protein
MSSSRRDSAKGLGYLFKKGDSKSEWHSDLHYPELLRRYGLGNYRLLNSVYRIGYSIRASRWFSNHRKATTAGMCRREVSNAFYTS